MWHHNYNAQTMQYEIIDSETKQLMCTLPSSSLRAKYELDANLIAAAPELYNELSFIVEFIDRSSKGENDDWKAMIARAQELLKEVTTSKVRRPINVRINIDRTRGRGTIRSVEENNNRSGIFDEVVAESQGNEEFQGSRLGPDHEVYHNECENNSGIDTDRRGNEASWDDVPVCPF